MNKLIKKISSFPNSPGVYKFYSKEKIVYVGKSKTLRNRVRSYFTGNDSREKIAQMMYLIDDVKIEVFDSHLEAKIEEYKYIQRFKPIYNSQYKRIKDNYYFEIDRDKLILINKTSGIGPFLGKRLIESFHDNLQKLFPLNLVEEIQFEYNIINIKLNHNSKESTYKALKYIFSSKNNIDRFILQLKNQMLKESKNLFFERANFYKILISQFNYIAKYIFEKRNFLHSKYEFVENDTAYLIINGEIVEKTKKFTYLGYLIDDSNLPVVSYTEEMRNIVFGEFMADEIYINKL